MQSPKAYPPVKRAFGGQHYAADTKLLGASLRCVSEKELDAARRLPQDREDLDELVRLTKALRTVRY